LHQKEKKKKEKKRKKKKKKENTRLELWTFNSRTTKVKSGQVNSSVKGDLSHPGRGWQGRGPGPGGRKEGLEAGELMGDAVMVSSPAAVANSHTRLDPSRFPSSFLLLLYFSVENPTIQGHSTAPA
jgi:hypothetical protein